MITFVATAYEETVDAYCFTASLINQTDPRWKAVIYCDKPNPYIKQVVELLNDSRITYIENLEAKGKWGHYNRVEALNTLVDTEFILQTSIQDYYIPTTVGEILKYEKKADLIYFNCLHNHFNYETLNSQLRQCRIDWGSFAVRTSIAKKVGINHPESGVADGVFVEQLCKYPGLVAVKINKTLTVHN